MLPILHSPNLILRPFVPADALAFAEAVRESSATLPAWMPWAHAGYSSDAALAWIDYCSQEWERRGSCEFGLFDAAGAFVGGCGLNQFNQVHGFCMLGYWVRTARQGHGLATEAIGALAAFGCAQPPVQRIEIVVGMGNGASLAAARKAGAVEEGIARNRLRIGDRTSDAHMLALTPTCR